jgi:hypothetical protein
MPKKEKSRSEKWLFFFMVGNLYFFNLNAIALLYHPNTKDFKQFDRYTIDPNMVGLVLAVLPTLIDLNGVEPSVISISPTVLKIAIG